MDCDEQTCVLCSSQELVCCGADVSDKMLDTRCFMASATIANVPPELTITLFVA